MFLSRGFNDPCVTRWPTLSGKILIMLHGASHEHQFPHNVAQIIIFSTSGEQNCLARSDLILNCLSSIRTCIEEASESTFEPKRIDVWIGRHSLYSSLTLSWPNFPKSTLPC